jgi:carboxylate-amine ligase
LRPSRRGGYRSRPSALLRCDTALGRWPVRADLVKEPALPDFADIAPRPQRVPVEEFVHRPEYTIGVEEELMLLDSETLELAQAIEPVLRHAGDRSPLKPELLQCQVEISTQPCRTALEALEELRALRRGLVAEAASCGIRVAAAGTHPFSPIEQQLFTARDRYRELVAALRYAARRVAVFGMHVHVAVGGGAKGLQIVEAMLPELPLLLALSASSPFLGGDETGLASTRIVLGQAMPRTGLPPAFETYEEYVRSLEQLRDAGAMEDSTYLWWDARLHPRFGTIEVRIMDVQPSVADAGAVAGLIQALVRHHGKRYDRGEGVRRANRFVIGENRWLAARYGLKARLVAGSEARSARELLLELVDDIASDAEAVDAAWALERIAEIAAHGSSAERQLALHRRGATLDEILLATVDETSA